MAYNLFPPSQDLSSDTYYERAIYWAVVSYENNSKTPSHLTNIGKNT